MDGVYFATKILKCGHENAGQARCGLCNSCWTCCKFIRTRLSTGNLMKGLMGVESEEVSKPAVTTDGIHAQLLYSISLIGKTKDIVLCTCGSECHIYRWSWAGHGKAKCKNCKRFICYRTLEVFDGDQVSSGYKK